PIIERGVRSAAGVPLRVGDRTVGVLVVEGKRRGQFDANTTQLLELLAAQTSPALEAARLFAETRQAYAELRDTQEQLLQAQRLETAGRLAGQVAHDFNNLLAPLRGFPELIKLR